MNIEMTHEQLVAAFAQSVRGMARVQARQEMLECIVLALIDEAPPAQPLFAQALRRAKSDWEDRSAQARDSNPPEIDADALALWNVLWRACAPPASLGTVDGLAP